MKKEFLAANYRQYPNPNFRAAECLLQKRIYDVIGTKYFLNAYEYNLEGREAFECEVIFTKNRKSFCVTVSNFESVQELENIFEDMWQKMCFDYADSPSNSV